MGTRGLSGFKYQDKYYLMYNQYDSYPRGLGCAVVEFINHVFRFGNFNTLKKRVSELTRVNNDIRPTPEQIEKYEKYSQTDVSEQTNNDWYCLMRDLQGKDILYEVYNGNITDFYHNEEFGKDSLFCEYAYVVNLDTMEVDFYEGFQKESQKGNYFGEKPYINTYNNKKSEYYPIGLVGSMEFIELFAGKDWKKEFYGESDE